MCTFNCCLSYLPFGLRALRKLPQKLQKAETWQHWSIVDGGWDGRRMLGDTCWGQDLWPMWLNSFKAAVKSNFCSCYKAAYMSLHLSLIWCTGTFAHLGIQALCVVAVGSLVSRVEYWLGTGFIFLFFPTCSTAAFCTYRYYYHHCQHRRSLEKGLGCGSIKLLCRALTWTSCSTWISSWRKRWHLSRIWWRLLRRMAGVSSSLNTTCIWASI